MMLRVTKLSQLASMSSKLRFWRLSGMSMPVALRQLSSGTGQEMYTPPKEEGEEGIEKAENEGEEEETDQEGEEDADEEGGPPVIKKTLKKYQSVILNDEKALEALTRDFENLRKGANYGPFSFNKKLDEVTDEDLSRLQNEAFDTYGNARDMRGKLNGMIKNLREPDFPDPVVVYQEVEDIVFAGLSTGEYKVIMDQDFEFLVSQKGFIPYLGVFFDRKFIDENPTIYTDRDLSTTLGLIVQDPAYMPLLELIKFIKPRHDTRNTGNLQKHIEQFLQLYGSSNQYNYFQLIHHLFNSLKATALQSIDFSLFTQKLLNVYWGQTTSKAAKQRFREHLHNLLFVKLNIQENQTLSYYFADMFLTASRYEDGLKIVGLTLLIINRLFNNSSSCNDLYSSFVHKFGQEKFTFYIKEKLPAILSLARKKKLADSCRQTVESFLASEVKHGELKPVVFDILDQGFYRADSKILYVHENNTVLDFDTGFNFYKEPKKQSPAKEDEDKVQQLKEALYHDKPQEFIKLFWEECQQTQEGKALFNEISKEYVKDPKLITNLTDEKAYGFLTALSRHLNQNFYEGTFEDTYLNKVVNAPYITYHVRNPEYQFQQTSGQTTRVHEKKPFTNFIGSKNTSEGAEGLGQAPKRSFSTTGGSEKPTEKSNPFKDFLKKAEEVDKTVKEQKITQEGIDQMKKTLFTEKKREKDDIQFAEIKTPRITPVQPKVQQVQPPKATFVLAPNYWENIIGEKTEANEIINAIENSFLTSNDPVKAMGAIHSFVTSDPFATKGIQNHKLVFYKMFNQPILKKLTPEEIRINALESKLEQLNLEPSPKLHLNIDTNFGIVEKDYNKYLTSNLFHYNLGDAGYQSILECLKDDYKRRYFKKCVSHMARFGTEVSIKNLELIADICYESKAGLTLIESAQLLIMNGLLHRPDQLAVIVNKLRLFKDLSDSCEHLAKSFAHYTGLPLSIEFLGPHLDLLMRFGKKERFMTIFDRLKDYLNNKKFKYDENLSAEENLKLQDKFKQENKLSLAQLYREYIEKLNSHSIYTFSKLLLKEQNELKLSSTSQDYINSLRVHKDNQAELEKILDIVKASEDNDFIQKALDTTLNVVTESGKRVKTIMPKVLDTFIYSHKIFPTRDLTHRIAFAMTRTTDASPLDKFVKFLEAEGPPLKYGTKILFLRLLNISEDAMLKSQQLAVVEHLFSKEVQERIKQREEKKQQRKAERKEALPEQPGDVKFAQIVQEKPVAPTKAEVIPEVVAEAEGEKKESKKEKKAKKANEKKQEAQAEAQKQAKEAEEKEKVSKTLREPEGLTSFLITSKPPRKSRAPKRVPGMTSTQRWRMEAYKEIGTATTKKPEGKEEKK